MKTRITSRRRTAAGYALAIVLVIGAVSLLVLGGSMRRTATTTKINDRYNQYNLNLNAAEAAIEKAIARMAYDFQYGYSVVVANTNIYQTNVPNSAESAYWNNFQFSDGKGNANRTYVAFLTNFTGDLPSQYPGLFTVNAPVYRMVSNARAATGPYSNMTNAVQVDVLLALVPLTQYAIFYHGLMEFSTCATMFVNGRTHANGNIYVGSSSVLTFNGTVTATGTIGAPANNGSGPWSFPGNVVFNGNPSYKTNVATVNISLTMTNTYSLIEMPPPGEDVTSLQGQQRLYNQAAVVLVVTNWFYTNVLATNSFIGTNLVTAKIQAKPDPFALPGSDPSPLYLTAGWTNGTALTNIQTRVNTNFPFLTLTNTFLDQRENKTNLVTQIDVGKYAAWLKTNSTVGNKYSDDTGTYPTILFVADNRTNTATQLSCVRIANGIAPPKNAGIGWSLATPNPLYVLGNYNCTNSAHLGTTNTSSTVPSAFFTDALTILSTNWSDTASWTDNSTGPNAASVDTVNAAILTGVKPSSSTATTGFSGGVHNLPRLLENWTGDTLWLNTSIINLYNSKKAIGQFITPGSTSYYVPPTRQWAFDPNFLNPAKVPPGVPCALVLVRKDWSATRPNTVN